MTAPRSERRRGSTALRDVLCISLACAALLWAGGATDTFDAIRRWLAHRMPGQADEVLFGVVLATTGLALFAVRRWRVAGRGSRARDDLDTRFRSLVEALPAAVYLWDPRDDARVRHDGYVGPQIASILGVAPRDSSGDPRTRLDAMDDEDRDRIRVAIDRLRRRGDGVTLDYRVHRPDGEVIWIREEAVAVERDAHGRPRLLQGLLTDVTERARAERQIAEAEARYRTLVERVPAVTYLWDATYRHGEAPAAYISPQVRHLLGYGQDEFGDPTLWDRLIHPDDRERVMSEWEACERGDVAFRAEYRMSTFDGRTVWVRDEAIPIGRDDDDHPYFQGVVFDITERRVAEERLRAAETRYRSLVEHMPVVAYLTDEASDPPERYVAPGVEALLGYTQGEWISDPHSWANTIHPEDRRRVLDESAAAMHSGEPFRSEYRLIAKDGSIVRVLDDAREVERDPVTGRAVWQGVLVDVTARAEAEQRLREAEERYRQLVEQLPVVVYQDAIDEHSTALYMSPRYEDMFGYPVEARLKDPTFWIRHLHPDDLDRVIAESERTNLTGDPFVMEYRFRARDGRWVWVRDEAVLLHDDGGVPRFWQGVLIDVTERRLAEETLSRRDAILEAVGFAAERFLKSDDWERTLPDILERLGTAAGVSRVYVFRNEELEDGSLAMSAHAEWLAPGVSSIHTSDSERHPYAPTFIRWQAALSAGREIHGLVGAMPAGERDALERENVRSLVIVPVWVGGDWWGFLGLDDCVEDRVWPSAEIEALKTAADTLGAAVGRARAEAERRAAEQRYRLLVEAIPAVTYMQSAEAGGSVYYVSPQNERLLGYTAQEWGPTFDTWVDSIHPDDRERVLAADRESDRSGAAFSQEYRQRHKDGHYLWVRDEAMLVHDDDGEPLFWQGIRFDITAQREAEQQVREAEQRYRALVEHIPSVLYIDPIDEDAPTIYVSPRVEEIFGITQRQYLDEVNLWRDLVHPDDREWMFEAYRRSLDEQTGWSVEYRVVRPDGRTIWVRDESAFLFDEEGRPLIVQGVMSDVTERKLAEEALQDSERREREAAERLRTLDEMKNTFLAAVSHELRSPLTSILGLALTLEQQELPRDEALELNGRLAQNARKLDRLLRDLLDIDRLSRGIVTPSLRATDLGELAARAVESLELPAGRHVEVDVEPVVVPVDAAKLERIVENLVMNAIRHTPADVTVWVRVTSEDGGALLAVEDDGPGVPAELRDAIFEPFRQGPTASPHSPGTGIGLSLVAMFTDLHGGRAWVEERPGGGASFRVSFPGTATSTEPTERAAVASGASSTGPRAVAH